MLVEFDRETPASSSSRSTGGSPTSASRGTSASTASRCSWSCSPACCSRSRCSASSQARLRRRTRPGCFLLEAGCIGVFLVARPVPVLRVLRDRARADVLPHRRVGPRQPRLRGDQVLPVHDARLGVHARRHRRHGVPAPAGDGGTLTFDLVEIAEDAGHRHEHGALAVPRRSRSPSRSRCRSFPLHTWLPDAHTEAPTAGSVVLAGVMLKMGTYGFLRFALYLFPQARCDFAPLLLVLGVIGIIYGAIVGDDADGPQTARRVLVGRAPRLRRARHLRAHDPGHRPAASLQMINHGLTTGALFLLVGMIYERRHTREIAELSGSAEGRAGLRRLVHRRDAVVDRPARPQRLRRRVPDPPRRRSSTARWWAVVAAIGVILAALYMLWAYQRVFHGEPDEDERRHSPTCTGTRGWCMVAAARGSSCSSASTRSRCSTASSPASSGSSTTSRTTRLPSSPCRSPRSTAGRPARVTALDERCCAQARRPVRRRPEIDGTRSPRC